MAWEELKFSKQLATVFILGTLLITIGFYSYAKILQEKIFLKNYSESTENIYETIKLGIEIGLDEENLQTIQRVFKWAKNEPLVEWIVLVDSENETFAEYPFSIFRK